MSKYFQFDFKHKLSIGDLDDKMKWLKNFERLLEIQRNVVWPGNTVSSNIIQFS